MSQGSDEDFAGSGLTDFEIREAWVDVLLGPGGGDGDAARVSRVTELSQAVLDCSLVIFLCVCVTSL